MQDYPFIMQKWTKSPAATQHIGVLLFDGFSNHCLANTVEPLRAANTLSGAALYAWQVLGLGTAPVTSSSGFSVTPQARLSHARGDMLMIMPSYGFRDHANWTAQAGLRAASGRFGTLVGLDTGSWLMAEAGLLDGYRATIHWEELTGFAERFPQVAVERQRFLVDRDRITCSGAMAAFDMVMVFIARDHGQALALEVAQLFMTRDSARSHGGMAASSSAVNRALALMQEHLEEPLPIPEIARRLGRTQKALEARMRAELGAGPAVVYRRLRLNVARKLAAETTLPISEIALRSGYADASAMTRAFRAEFGQAPTALRQSPG